MKVYTVDTHNKFFKLCISLSFRIISDLSSIRLVYKFSLVEIKNLFSLAYCSRSDLVFEIMPFSYCYYWDSLLLIRDGLFSKCARVGDPLTLQARVGVVFLAGLICCNFSASLLVLLIISTSIRNIAYLGISHSSLTCDQHHLSEYSTHLPI